MFSYMFSKYILYIFNAGGQKSVGSFTLKKHKIVL